jgi:hypothetical protein
MKRMLVNGSGERSELRDKEDYNSYSSPYSITKKHAEEYEIVWACRTYEDVKICTQNFI